MPLSTDTEYEKALTKYSASFMSNSKWLRLFRAVIASGAVIDHARWKLINSETDQWNALPKERDLMPKRFSDGNFQPFEYKWIESIFIPRRYKPIEGVGYEKNQDVSAILSALSAAGQFEVSESEEGITIHAYQER